MSEIKHTPGPWYAVKNICFWEIRTAEWEHGGEQIGDACASGFIDGKVDNPVEVANANLIAAAPELLEALSTRVDDAEQRVFEGWLARTSPSGAVEQVQDQWENSYDFSDFCEGWKAELAAIAKATGSKA